MLDAFPKTDPNRLFLPTVRNFGQFNFLMGDVEFRTVPAQLRYFWFSRISCPFPVALFREGEDAGWLHLARGREKEAICKLQLYTVIKNFDQLTLKHNFVL